MLSKTSFVLFEMNDPNRQFRKNCLEGQFEKFKTWSMTAIWNSFPEQQFAKFEKTNDPQLQCPKGVSQEHKCGIPFVYFILFPKV